MFGIAEQSELYRLRGTSESRVLSLSLLYVRQGAGTVGMATREEAASEQQGTFTLMPRNYGT